MLPAFSQEAGKRESITYLLGEDEDPALPMFRLAEEHFQRHPTERTDHLISYLRSLQDVKTHLAEHPPKDGGRWGLINLVAHGNKDLVDVAITPNGPRATLSAMKEALNHGAFRIPTSAIDSITEIRIHGCAVGKNPALLKALSKALSGSESEAPQVSAPKWFTCFRPSMDEEPMDSRHLCQNWSIVYKPGPRPNVEDLARRFKRHYPTAEIDPIEAMRRSRARFLGDTFSYEAPIRFTWTLLHLGAHDLPHAPSASQVRTWLLSQEGFRRSLSTTELAFDDLSWEVLPARIPLGGSSVPALVARGEGRAIHVLRSLKPEDASSSDDWKDERLYAVVR